MDTSQIVQPDEPSTQVLLLAKPGFFLGTFKVPFKQLRPHPKQRPLDQNWVTELRNRFLEVGVNRSNHPIKVLLEPSEEEELKVPDYSSIRTLPSSASGLIFEGQHRVAACKLLDDPHEHWWYAEIYTSELEASHPAEFLTSMHSSNEENFRLVTTDADRFLAMHALLEMKHSRAIQEDTYRANQRVLEGYIVQDTTRYGLRNLLRSEELANTIAQALEHIYLRPTFNASTWGKKLVKGRLYPIATGLVREMVEQAKLLKGNGQGVSAKPFGLPAHSCTWSQLKHNINRKDHQWHELEGGAKAAFERVKARPPKFVHLMNALGSNGWMLNEIVLLPTVLTSDTVLTCLQSAYVIAQHMIHMTAGPKALARYTTTRADESEEDHPFGIISIVLRDQFRGKSSNYPNKIFQYIWNQRAPLLHDLKQCIISDAAATTEEEYQQLLHNSHNWWELLSLFKMRVLSKGLNLDVPKEFGSSYRDATRSRHSSSTVDLLPQKRTPQVPAHLHVIDSTSEERSSQRVTGLPVISPGTDTSPNVDSLGSSRRGPTTSSPQIHPESSVHQLGHKRKSDRSNKNPARKSPRVEARGEPAGDNSGGGMEDEDFVGQPGPESGPVDVPLGEALGSVGLRTHSRLIAQVEDLQNSVPLLQVDETQALVKLLEQLNELRGSGCLPRVVQALSERIEGLTRRARRAEQVIKCFDNEEDSN